MSIEYDVLDFSEVVDEFVDVGETIDDISLIRFTFELDTHWDSFELNLSIFGTGDPDTECPVLDIPVDAEVLLHNDNPQGIDSKKLPPLFEDTLIEEIVDRGVPVIWNQGDETEVRINLADPGDIVLLPMIH